MRLILRLFLLLALLQSHQLFSQTLMHYWHFNNFVGVTAATNPDNLVPYRADFTVLDTNSVKTIYKKLPGTSNAFTSFWDGSTIGDTTNLRLGQTAGQYLRLRNPSDSMQLQFFIPSTGYQNITLKYTIQRSSAANGATVNRFQYSLDSGTTWISTGLSIDTFATAATWTTTPVTVSINNPAANNNPRLAFRILFQGIQNTGTGGNNRIDNVSIEGNPFVAPQQVLLHYWHFNNFVSGLTAAVNPNTIAPYRADTSRIDTNTAKVAFRTIAGTSSLYATFWDNVTGDTSASVSGYAAGLGLRPRNPTDSMQLLWYIPTTDYYSPEIKFACQRSSASNGAAVLRFAYSIDSGATWLNTGLSIDTFATSAAWTSTPTIRITNPLAENNRRLVFRTIFGAPGTSGTSGNLRMDNFSVRANTAPSTGGPIVDVTPPTVAFNPTNGATLINRTTKPSLTFNENVRLTNNIALDSINIDTIVELRLNNAMGAPIPFNAQLSANARVITIFPDTLLGFGVTYYVALKGNRVKDSSNNVQANTLAASFTTETVQTIFNAGDLLPLAYRTNAIATPDEIALLTFVNILPGTRINFTDAKYTSNIPAQCTGGFTWTAPASGVPAGATLIISTDNGTANVGTITGATFGLSSSGDQIIIYTGTNTNPIYVTALSSIAWATANISCTGSLSLIPAGLNNTNSFTLSQVNAYYNGTQNGTIAQLKAAILDSVNWIGAIGSSAPQNWPTYTFFGPPTVKSARVVNATTLEIAYSSNMDSASAVTAANYTGITGINNIVVSRNGALADTVWLTYTTPFVGGSTNTLTINNVKDDLNRTIFTPYVFSFVYNTSIAFDKAFVSVKEDTGSVNIRLNLSNPSTSSIRLSLKAAPWTNADSTNDFTFASQTLNFTGSSNSIQNFNIPIANDVLKEQDEYLVIEMQVLSGATIVGNNQLTVFIRDNDNLAPVETKEIELVHKYSFDPNPAGSTTEVITFDSTSKRLFTSSAIQNRVDIIDFSNPDSAVRVGSIDMTPYGGLTSLAAHNGILAVASPNLNPQLNGSVVFFNTNGTFLKQVTVGALPDMITFTPDGKKVLTGDEGQPNDAYTVDPEGSVSIIDISGGIANLTQSNVKTLNFTRFNAVETALIASGVRKTKASSTLSQDIEPEYITVSEDNSKAWVALQENNSMAEISLVTDSIITIWPLGVKEMNAMGNGFDASDNSTVVHLSNWPVKAFYMPDAIANYKVGNDRFIVTANEGDEKEYAGLSDRTTVGNIATILDPTIFPHAAWLKQTFNLGRFRITNLNGDTDKDGDYDELYTVGARSFSIFNATTKQLVYDSKGDFELITSQHPKSKAVFNANHEDNGLKGRSHSKGPEPEAITMANIWGKQYAFIGLERVGGVMVYDVTNPLLPVFVDYNNTRNLSSYGGDNGPEITLYISPERSPNGKPYILVSNEISGTITVFEVKNNRTPSALSFTQATQSAQESAGTVMVKLNITPKAQTNGKVVLRRVNGVNTTSTDYTNSPAFVNDSLVLNINANDSTIGFNMNIVDDSQDELNETVTYQILSATNGFSLASPNSLIFTILDNDTTLPVRTANFALSNLNAKEDTGNVNVKINLNGALSGAGQIVLKANKGLGLSNEDFSTTPTLSSNDSLIINLANGATEASFNLTIVNDTLDENNETLNFSIVRTSANISIGTNSQFDLTIIDNDSLANSIQEIGKPGKMISMYPNPNNMGMLYFSEYVAVEIFDIQGKLLLSDNRVNEVKISNLAKGIYTVRLDGTTTRKLVIE
jgi:hypothetical protein